jgi:hypothetical protein
MPRAIDLLVDEIVPAELRGKLTDLSGSNVNDFLVDLYTNYPDQYKKISHDLGRLGAKAAYIQGETLGLEDFEPVVDKPLLLAAMNDEIAAAKQKLGNTDQFKKARESIWVKYNDMMLKNTMAGAKATNNKIGHAVISGARGKPSQMQAMLTTPGLYADSKGDIVPMFVENSFAEGLRPLEFAAGMFGARASVISTKAATAKGGDYGKLLSQASARLVVTDKDCGVQNGLAYDIDDNTARNRVLAKDVGNFKAGTLLTREVIADLKKSNVNKVVARSPLTCNADGLCSQCVGVTFEKRFPKIGEHIGITAANALCLDEDTEVLMYEGSYKKIKDVKPGDKVYGVDKQGNMTPSTVLDNYDRGVQECFSYSYKHAESEGKLIATKNHRCIIGERDSTLLVKNVLKPLSDVVVKKDPHQERYDLFPTPHGVLYAITKVEGVGLRRTRDLYIDHPDHVFVIKDFIQVHNSEPVTQGALSAKHTGGQATQKGEYGGFPILSQFVQSPSEYIHKAITSDEDGQVSQIEEAPQGGYNVTINNKPYYVKPGYPLTVKVGQNIEAGTPLSEGIVDARDVVEKVGLGAGRKYWVDRIQKIYKDSGLYADKKNLEIVARGTLDTVSLNEEIEGLDAYADDTINYNKVKKVWKPQNSAVKPIQMTTNKYLTKDTLEHTIGTRITPSIQKQLQEVGVNELEVSEDPPPFAPNMDRLRTASHYNDDWLAGLSTSYLKKQLEDSALRAGTTNVKENIHWAPRVAVGIGFGEKIKQTGKF